ncbi:FxSxx-COOH system tetratricopeptide repeat protein [Actinomadura fibrosa]|uniref:FxSxx-COOH system tetratricopeptide repeat protein n=1 Tax=Actinomadura fibrosa TaxID=111802 RepID=A0ABW2XT64_9ACTN|nr:FxSxx-COOH system tetratricopeptide repeat protein [Actinomadura fibrosa]
MTARGSSKNGPHVECVAFVAATARLGRTATVVNTALVLAGAGKRVLIIDWSAEPPPARGYFTPFHVGESEPQQALSRELDRLTGPRADVWRTESFLPPGAVHAIDLAAPSVREERGPALPLDDPPADLTRRLRRSLDGLPYDFALVDVPTDPSERIIEIVARGADQAVVLFEPGARSVTAAADLAAAIRPSRPAGAGVRVVPLEVDLGTGAPGDGRSPDRVADEFARFLPGGEGAPLRVPFDPQMADRQMLITLAAESGSGAARGYARLAAELTDGEVTELPELPDRLRSTYPAALGTERAADAGHYTVVTAWPDRRYGDWVRAQLREAGAGADLVSPGDEVVGRAIWIVSDDLLGLLPEGMPDDPEALALLVPGADARELPEGTSVIDLGEENPEQLKVRLYGRLGLVRPAVRYKDYAVEPRFPAAGRHPGFSVNFGVPSPAPFHGRVEELARMRDRLLAGTDGCAPFVVTGPAGIGKSSLVLEYLRFFRDDYALIHWISARTPELVRAGLVELAERLGVTDRTDEVAAVIRKLLTYPRPWLLVYDDAGDLDDLRDAIPLGGPGHALITMRTAPETVPWDGAHAGRDLTRVEPRQGAALLLQRVGALTPERAGALSELLHGVPLALHLAACWLRESAEWLRATGNEAVDTQEKATEVAAAVYSARVEEYLDGREDAGAIAAALAVTLRTLRETEPDRPLHRLVIRLAEMCAWLAPEGVAHRLLSTMPFLDVLEGTIGPEDPELVDRDSMVLDQVLEVATRFGLGRAVWKRGARFRMHRSVQELIPGRLAADGIAEDRHGEVLEALGRTVPAVVDGPIQRHEELFTELHRHLGPSRAADSTNRWVRRWIAEQLRFEYATGREAEGRELLDVVAGLPERWPDDRYTARLLGQTANIRRQLGRFQAASDDNDRAQEILEREGPRGRQWHLAGRRGRSADLRGLGRFPESLNEIQGVFEDCLALYGDDHRETVVSRINLAESEFLMGYHSRALRTADKAWRQRVAEFGGDDWRALKIARRVGDYRGASGDWRGARVLLKQSLDDAAGMPAPNRLAVLELMRSLAIAERHVVGPLPGDPHERIIATLGGLGDLLGAEHPSTRAAELTLAVEYAVAGNLAAARGRAKECGDAFAAAGYCDAHPVVQLCRVDLGAFLLEGAAPDPDQALGILEDARATLSGSLGDTHPWTVTARLHEARALADLGRFDRAREYADLVTAAAESLDDGEPYHRAAGAVLEAAESKRAAEPGDPRMAIYLDAPLI